MFNSVKKTIVICCIGFLFQIFSPVTAQQIKKDSATKPKKFLAIPTLNYNRSLGLEVGATIMFFNNFKNDTVSPPSISGIKGYYTTNKSWVVFAFQRLFYQQDNWRSVWVLGTGDVNFQFYTEEIPGGDFIDYTTTRNFIYFSTTKRIYARLYAGLSIMYTKLNTEFYTEEYTGGNEISTKKLVGLGIPIVWDSRNSIFNPSKGIESKINIQINNKIFGSDLNFNAINITSNLYKKLRNKSVLANRITIYSGLGEVPFEGTKAIGKNDIRGYTKGEYRGKQTATIQSEYRRLIKNNWSYVGFFGLASTFNTTKNKKWSGILPGAGAGIRYMLLPSKKMNLGIDAAVGKNDWGVYFRIGEAF